MSEKENTDWFFTDEWQAGEREVDEDFKNGRFDTVNTSDELLALFRRPTEQGEEKP